jgi:hypothetical protein
VVLSRRPPAGGTSSTRHLGGCSATAPARQRGAWRQASSPGAHRSSRMSTGGTGGLVPCRHVGRRGGVQGATGCRRGSAAERLGVRPSRLPQPRLRPPPGPWGGRARPAEAGAPSVPPGRGHGHRALRLAPRRQRSRCPPRGLQPLAPQGSLRESAHDLTTMFGTAPNVREP